MKLIDLINRLKSLLEKEVEILSEFPISNIEDFVEIQEKKRQILLDISKYSEEDIEAFQKEFLEIYKLNSTVSALLTNQIAFFEELEKELFGEGTTYKKPEKSGNFFKGRV